MYSKIFTSLIKVTFWQTMATILGYMVINKKFHGSFKLTKEDRKRVVKEVKGYAKVNTSVVLLCIVISQVINRFAK